MANTYKAFTYENSEKQCIKIYNLYNSYKIYKFVAKKKKKKKGREHQCEYMHTDS